MKCCRDYIFAYSVLCVCYSWTFWKTSENFYYIQRTYSSKKKLIIFFSTHYSRTFNNAIVLTVLLNRPTAFKIRTTLIRRGKWNSAPLSHIAKSHRFSLVFTNHCIHWNVLVRKFFGNLGVFKKKIIIITCGDGRTIARFQFTASEACSSSTTTTTSFQSIA